MTRTKVSATVGVALLASVAWTCAQADTITEWNFGAVAATTPDNTPAPTTGVGTATSLGMTNNYTYGTKTGSVTADDITNDGATSTQTGSSLGNGDVWRIRGQTPGNGWNTAAPQYSQGVEFDVSTVGFTGIGLSFNWASTTQGDANMQVQYTTDGSTWQNVGALLTATIDNGTPGTAGFGFTTDSIDLSGIMAANNDPNFGIRLVSAYNPTVGTYASATSVLGGSPVAINNTSGNWRIADVALTGTVAPVPLPAAAWLLFSGLGGLGLFGRRRSA